MPNLVSFEYGLSCLPEDLTELFYSVYFLSDSGVYVLNPVIPSGYSFTTSQFDIIKTFYGEDIGLRGRADKYLYFYFISLF